MQLTEQGEGWTSACGWRQERLTFFRHGKYFLPFSFSRVCVLGSFRGQRVPSLFLVSHTAALRKVFSPKTDQEYGAIFYHTDAQHT